MFKQFFVITDVHSFYNEMIEALDKAGFDKENPNHVLVSCGDLFDRGPNPEKVLNYVMSVPKDRRIFIMGNHDDRLKNILDGHRVPDDSDAHNGTVKTILELAHLPVSNAHMARLRRVPEAIEILKGNEPLQTYLSECRDFYETDEYIFTHGWIPLKRPGFIDEPIDNSEYYRTADKGAWFWAKWTNGFEDWYDMWWNHKEYNMKLPDKTIVCGHWHTSWAHHYLHNDGLEFPGKGQKKSDCKFTPFYDHKIIGLDACTAYSGFCNCVVLDIEEHSENDI